MTFTNARFGHSAAPTSRTDLQIPQVNMGSRVRDEDSYKHRDL